MWTTSSTRFEKLIGDMPAAEIKLTEHVVDIFVPRFSLLSSICRHRFEKLISTLEELRFNFGWKRLQRGDYEMWQELYKKTHREMSAADESVLEFGWTLFERDDYKMWRKLYKLTVTEMLAADESMVKIGWTLLQRGDYKMWRELYKKTHTEMSAADESFVKLVWTLLQNSNYEMWQILYKMTLKEMSVADESMVKIVWTLLQRGDYEMWRELYSVIYTEMSGAGLYIPAIIFWKHYSFTNELFVKLVWTLLEMCEDKMYPMMSTAGYTEHNCCACCFDFFNVWRDCNAGDNDSLTNHSKWFPSCSFPWPNKGEKSVHALRRQQEQECKIRLEEETDKLRRDTVQGDKEKDQRNVWNHPFKEYLQLGYSEDTVSLDWKSLKWIFTIFVYLLVLSSVCAVRINVKECPVTETAWNARSQIVECISGEVYHCIQDDYEQLMETCMVPYLIKPFYEGGCPWASYKADRKCVLGGIFHTCEGNGCPLKNDSDYLTTELYKYPKCLQHHDENKQGIQYTKSVLDVIDTTSKYDTKETVLVFTAVGAGLAGLIVGLLALAIVVVVFVPRWLKKSSRDNSNNSLLMPEKEPGKKPDVEHELICIKSEK